MTADGDGPGAAMRAVALAGLRSGKSRREIAVDLYGAARVDAEWSPDSRLRAKVRRLVQCARAETDGAPGGAGPGTS